MKIPCVGGELRLILFFLLLLEVTFPPGEGTRTLDEVPRLSYTQEGHITLGVLVNMYHSGQVVCRHEAGVGGLQYVMAALYGLEMVNNDPSLLGDIRLGVSIFEECDKPLAAVAQALALISSTNVTDLSRLGLRRTATGDLPPLLGVVGPVTSSSSIAVSPLLGLADVPLISPAATSDDLTSREAYPNFFRMVPPDSFQAGVMIDLLAHLNWTYAVVAHAENSYGYNALTQLRRHSRDAGVCLADAFPLSHGFDDADYEETVDRIRKVENARVVLVVAYSGPTRRLLQAAARLGVKGYVWILSDAAYAATVSGTELATRGSFLVDWHVPSDPQYESYVRQTRLAFQQQQAVNPFFREAWEQLRPESCHSPSGGGGGGGGQCASVTFEQLEDFWFSSSTLLAAQAVVVLARALDAHVREHCPEALRRPSELLSACFRTDAMIEALYNVTISTAGGTKGFDRQGQMALDFRLRQVQEEVVQVGIWRRRDSEIEWWKELKWAQDGTAAGLQAAPPESVCAKPCAAGEFYIQGELECCWECYRCRNNEYVAENATACLECPTLTWPDQENFTDCLPIPPIYLSWDDPYGVALIALAAAGITSALVLIGTVVKHRRRRVIKGASWEMLLVILLGVMIAFANVILSVVRASDVLCLCSRLVFSLACTLIFSPLVIKTFRVYLVFRASNKLSQVSKLAHASVQYTMTLLLILVQCALLAVATRLWPARAELAMPVATLRYVELTCSQEQIGLLTPLSYNLFLLLLCSLIAFLTRKLPDNFNESWYIFLSVTTTLFIWVAFLPTYFAAFYAYHKEALLALALTLNGVVTVVCLFLPKVYALIFIKDKDIKITDFSTTGFENPSTSTKNTAPEQ